MSKIQIEIKSLSEHSIYVTVDNLGYVSSISELLNIKPYQLEELYKRYTDSSVNFLWDKMYIFTNTIDAQKFIDDLQPYILMRELTK